MGIAASSSERIKTVAPCRNGGLEAGEAAHIFPALSKTLNRGTYGRYIFCEARSALELGASNKRFRLWRRTI